jgi:hypothetical protein
MKNKTPVVPQPKFAHDPSPADFFSCPQNQVDLTSCQFESVKKNTKNRTGNANFLEIIYGIPQKMEASLESRNCRKLCQKDNVSQNISGMYYVYLINVTTS